MRKHLKMSLAVAAVLMAGCQTYNLEQNRQVLTEQKSAELITRSEVMAVVSTVDVAIDLEQQAAHWGYDLKRKESLPALGLYMLTFDCPPGIDPHIASAELEKLQPKSTVEAIHKYTLQADISDNTLEGNSESFNVRPLTKTPLSYANGLIEWPDGGCEALKKIGIIDGGVDEDSVKLNHAAIYSRTFSEGEQASSAVKHGTAIAELLVGPGRLKNAELYSASVISKDKNGDVYTGVEPMLKAINWMVESGVEVINISLAGPYNRTLDRGIQRAVDKGVIIVAAVGNAGAQASPQYPAALNTVIAATAVDSRAQIYNKAVHGRHVDVAAPGVEVYVGSEDTGRYVSGTSIATPFIVAQIAGVTQFADARTPEAIRTILSKQAEDLGERGRDSVYGFGLVQANKTCVEQ